MLENLISAFLIGFGAMLGLSVGAGIIFVAIILMSE